MSGIKKCLCLCLLLLWKIFQWVLGEVAEGQILGDSMVVHQLNCHSSLKRSFILHAAFFSVGTNICTSLLFRIFKMMLRVRMMIGDFWRNCSVLSVSWFVAGIYQLLLSNIHSSSSFFLMKWVLFLSFPDRFSMAK